MIDPSRYAGDMDDGYNSPEAKATRARMARQIHDKKPHAYHGLLGIDSANCRLCQQS